MTKPLTVFAIIEAPEADIHQAQTVVAELAKHSVLEAGCLEYTVYLSEKSPKLLIIHEIWATGAALELHRQAPHVTQFKASLGGTTTEVWASRFELLE